MKEKEAVLVTGGAGYIGSHVVLKLLAAGYRVLVFDNLSNGSAFAMDRVSAVRGERVDLECGDVRDAKALDRVFASVPIRAVVHLAGLKGVARSAARPMRFYENNVCGTLRLCKAMARHGVRRMVFASSTAVYGEYGDASLCAEGDACRAVSAYGRSKILAESLLEDLCRSDGRWSVSVLRSSNVVGAHPSGRVGEAGRGAPSNLMPLAAQVAAGKRSFVPVFGRDYRTPDGTGMRDYVHVEDLADGCARALESMQRGRGHVVYNLGTGTGYSVLEVLEIFARVSGRRIPYRVAPRREGDVAICRVDVSRARDELDWQALRNLEDMCADAWKWQRDNPAGYRLGGDARAVDGELLAAR